MKPQIDLDQLAHRESEQVEWKESVADIDDVVAVLSAFANDLANLGGGYVVCGATEATDEHGFSVMRRTGLTASRLREVEGKVLARCRERVSPPLAPLVDELPADSADRRILVFTIAATPHAHVFRHDDGAAHYVRVGRSTRQARNGLLLQLLARKNEVEPWDRRACPKATIDDINRLVLNEALVRMDLPASRRSDTFLSDSEQLHALVPPLCAREPLTGALRPRNFALLLFGRAPQRFIPGAHAYFSRYPGTDRGTDFAERYELIGSLFEQTVELTRLLTQEASLVMDKTNPAKPNADRYPERALKEALGNALAHRDYALPDPTRVTAFADRIELHSPGALPAGISLAQLRRGRVGPRWRNQTLSWVFMKLGLAQGEGQGLTTMRAQMRAAGSPPPRFDADEVSVTCTLRAHPASARVRAATKRGRGR